MSRKNKRNRQANSQMPTIMDKNVTIKDMQTKIDDLEMINLIQSTSQPRSLMYGATSQKSIISVTRDVLYQQRKTMLEDPFIRQCITTIISRSIGTTYDSIRPFNINLADGYELKEKESELMKEEFKNLELIIDKDLLEVATDAQAYSDGYAVVDFEVGKGVLAVRSDISTKPFNITPYVTNRGNKVAYEVSANTNIIGKVQDYSIEKNGRNYVNPIRIARMSALSNGIRNLTSEQLTFVDNMNVFEEEEKPYEDLIFGGILEGVWEAYQDWQLMLKSLSDGRVDSNAIERWLTVSLNSLNEKNREEMKKSLHTSLVNAKQIAKDRIEDKSTNKMITTHIIPTVGDNATGAVNIQESSPNAVVYQTEDVLFSLKNLMGAIGFDINLTAFSDSRIGGSEKDGMIQNSIQMDTQGEMVRKSIRAYIEDIITTHFHSKFNKIIDMKKVAITFTSIINQSNINAETQRQEAISNTEMSIGMINTIKSLGLSDIQGSDKLVKSWLDDTVKQTAEDREELINTAVKIAMIKPPPEEEL